ncbi:hypothetical protein ACQKCJ_13860 [Flavobacterium sp. NPDC079362]
MTVQDWSNQKTALSGTSY